ncbi:MAG: DUF550 domain-containing protein [Kiritimatiellae bacterium]|nr:DUF550 domain-containing protein [Kiritimatiellia bacterium]
MQIDSVIDKTIEELHEKLGHPDIDVEARKIASKLEEAHYNPGDVMPLADCIIAILLAGRNQGFSPSKVFDAVTKVCENVSGRDWKQMPDGTYHVQ